MRLVLIALVLAAACHDASPGDDCRSSNTGQVPPTPPDPPLVCPLTVPPDPHAGERAACTFAAGATPEQTLGLPASLGASLPVRHVIVMMKENRSYDHLFGRLHEEGQSEAEAIPSTFFNPDSTGALAMPFHATPTCVKHDPNHQWEALHEAMNDGAMNGFVRSAAETTTTDGHFVMGWYDQSDLPFDYWLANTFAIGDRHFASVRSGTFPNRDFLYLGTNDGIQSTGITSPDEDTPSIFGALTDAGYSFGAYSDGPIFSAALGWSHNHAGAYCLGDFFERLDTGTLPNVAFVDARSSVDGDHPPADVQVGEAWVRNVYEHAVRSPQWPRLAIVFTYDECGGYADHVPPPGDACIARPIAKDQPYFELGPRTPLLVISPYAKPHYVSHVVMEHTAITRFIESLFGLPALTARDANSPGLLDLFDFSCEPKLLAPPDAPDSGTGGCP